MQEQGPASEMVPSLSGGAQPHSMPNVAVQKERFGGYDCEIIKPPPSVYQTKCPICHLILRDPYESKCCDHSFCYTCSQRVQKDNSPCPWCRNDKLEVKQNRSMRRALNQLEVFCTYRRGGCKWRGELRDLQAHIHKTDHSSKSLQNEYA